MVPIKAFNSFSFPAPDGFEVINVEQIPRSTIAPVRVVHPDPMFLVTLAPRRATKRGWHRLTIRFPPDGTVDVIAQLCFSDGEEFWRRLPARERNHFVLSIRCNSSPATIKLIVSGSGYLLRPSCIEFRPVRLLSGISGTLARIPSVFRQHGLSAIGTIVRAGVRFTEPRSLVLVGGPVTTSQEVPYDRWIRVFDEAPTRDRQRHLERRLTLTHRPLFSVLLTMDDCTVSTIDGLARSLAEQIYPNWELVIAVPQTLVVPLTTHLVQLLPHNRVVVTANAADDAATRNHLAGMAAGDFLLDVPIEAILRSNALLEVALTLEAYPEAGLIYSDEDQIGAHNQRQNPIFKPAWSPDLFDVIDYFGHLTVMSRKAVTAVGGWKSELGTACEYDLRARIVDHFEPAKIVHLAKILVHINSEKAAAEPKQHQPIEQAIRNHCERRHVRADIIWPETAPYPRLKYRIPDPPPLVSLLIPTRDRANILETCVRSVLTHTTYQPYEIVIIDNDSQDAATHRLFEELRIESAVRIMASPGPFNFSALNNVAARKAKGSIIGLLNNDLEVIDGGWLDEMVALASRPEVGCVGCKLLYPDGHIQHAGICLGIGGLAGHGHRHALGNALGYMHRLRMLQNVSAVTAACLLMRKEVFFQVGGLDDKKLTVAYNDVDLCLKVMAAGYRNVCTPFAELIHHESISRGGDYVPAKARRFCRESNVVRRRWGAELFADPYYSPHLTHDREDFSVRDW
jgi:O-antigen biosynthesis protein